MSKFQLSSSKVSTFLSLKSRLQFLTDELENRGLNLGLDCENHTPTPTPAPTPAPQQPVKVTGTAGNDTLNGDPALDSIIDGLAGNDTLTGGAGNDILTGGVGADRIDTGTGFDIVSYSGNSESSTAQTDTLVGLDFGGVDAASAVDQLQLAGVTVTGVSRFDVSGTTFVNFQAFLDANQMPAGQAVVLHVLNGPAANRDFLYVDGNNTAGFQSAGDYAIELVGTSNLANLDISDFIA